MALRDVYLEAIRSPTHGHVLRHRIFKKALARDADNPTEEELIAIYTHLLPYAMGRLKALHKDNSNKAQGILPERRYKSNLDRAEEARLKREQRKSTSKSPNNL